MLMIEWLAIFGVTCAASEEEVKGNRISIATIRLAQIVSNLELLDT